MNYVAPHDLFRAWLTLVSISLACAAAVFVLAGSIQGEVSLVNLFWMTILAALIARVVTWEFRRQGRIVTIGQIIRLQVGRSLPVPDDLDDARMRLIVCKARIEQLERSRR